MVDLPLASFSIVMATEIVATAADIFGPRSGARVLLAINVLVYLVLAALTILRLIVAPDRLRGELHDHALAPGAFTIVAGTCVLGTGFVLFIERPMIALILWALGVSLWLVLTYYFFTVMTVNPERPRLERALNGGWMLIVVSTQSVSILGTLLAPMTGLPRGFVLGLTTSFFLVGCILYLLLFALVLYRFLFFPVDPVRLTPPYWITMGAVAITTLAGSLLVIHAPEWDFLVEIRPFLAGFTLLFWATATWWIPLLLILGAWRHIVRRVPLRYDIQVWSMVFPIGMYAVATFRLTEALDWPGLVPVAGVVGYLSMTAWLLAAIGLIRVVGKSI